MITISVCIGNNSGVAGAKITIGYDDSVLTLTDASAGEAFSSLDYTQPGKFESTCNFTWDSLSGEAASDGVILTLTFTVSSTATSGQAYQIDCTYVEGDIYDEELNNVTVIILDGKIISTCQQQSCYLYY